MAHSHDGFDRAVLAHRIQDGVEKRDECGDAFERITLGAKVADLENLFEEVRADKTFENFPLVDFELWTFDTLRNPLTPFGLRQVHEFGADGAAIDAAGFVGGFASESKLRMFQRTEKTEGIECGFVITPAAKGVENSLPIVVNDCGFL